MNRRWPFKALADDSCFSLLRRVIVSQTHPKIFIGRKAELRAALKALINDKHVFVRGPYGIGKTTFAYALLSACEGPHLVISLQESPSEMAEKMIEILSTYQPGPRPERSVANAVYFHDRRTRIKSFKILKTLMEQLCVYRFPIVVDDFRKISTSKLAFLNMLASMGFRLILAIDSGYEKRNIESLEKSCPIHVWIDLPRLTIEESKELISCLFREQNAVPDPEQVRLWGKVYQGYPLQLVDRVRKFLGSTLG